MKRKTLLFAAFLGLGSIANAQTTTMESKNGHEILPQAGDIAIGMDAVPILDFGLNAINIMNNTGQTAQHPGFVSGFNQVLSGKYFLSETRAVRARVGINTENISTKDFGDNPLTPSLPTGVAENVLISTSNTADRNVFLGGGMEFRRGHNRLQGYYGGEVFLGFASTSTKNSYEIEFNQTAVDSGYVGSLGNTRVLSSKTGTAITFGLRGFAGVEYFFAPKISIGAEFGWGFGLTTSPRGSNEEENWGIAPGSAAGATDAAYIMETPDNNQGRSMGFGVDSGIGQGVLDGASAALMIHFHF